MELWRHKSPSCVSMSLQIAPQMQDHQVNSSKHTPSSVWKTKIAGCRCSPSLPNGMHLAKTHGQSEELMSLEMTSKAKSTSKAKNELPIQWLFISELFREAAKLHQRSIDPILFRWIWKAPQWKCTQTGLYKLLCQFCVTGSPKKQRDAFQRRKVDCTKAQCRPCVIMKERPSRMWAQERDFAQETQKVVLTRQCWWRTLHDCWHKSPERQAKIQWRFGNMSVTEHASDRVPCLDLRKILELETIV